MARTGGVPGTAVAGLRPRSRRRGQPHESEIPLPGRGIGADRDGTAPIGVGFVMGKVTLHVVRF